MPIRETLTAKPVALAEVLSNGKRYIVPPFQRDYAWDTDEWAELWADIVEVHRAALDANHYLGALVLQPTAERSDSKIIDGQQRLVTLSLLALVISLRASVARVNTGDLQRAYHGVAFKIEQGELKSPLAIARALSGVTTSDDDFKTTFSQLVLDPRGPRKRLVRYLLSELEVGFGGQRIDFDASESTVEHILPENASNGWASFSHEERQRDVRRLGNLTPLEYVLNKAIGNADYERKREAYARSSYYLTRAIVQADWSPAAIRARQQQMAECAVTIWHIDDLDS